MLSAEEELDVWMEDQKTGRTKQNTASIVSWTTGIYFDGLCYLGTHILASPVGRVGLGVFLQDVVKIRTLMWWLHVSV